MNCLQKGRMFTFFLVCLFLFYVLYRQKPRFERLNVFLKHMLDQVSNNIVKRLRSDKLDETQVQQLTVQRGLEQLRQAFPEGISEDVQKLLECLMQLSFNFGGPALLFKITNQYDLVDKTQVYDRLILLVRTLGKPEEFEKAVISCQQKGQELQQAWVF